LLYCATVEDARVVKYLENEPRCGYEIAADLPPYCGVRGQARAQINLDQGPEILEALLYRYLGGLENHLAENLLKDVDREVALVLDPHQLLPVGFFPAHDKCGAGHAKIGREGLPVIIFSGIFSWK